MKQLNSLILVFLLTIFFSSNALAAEKCGCPVPEGKILDVNQCDNSTCGGNCQFLNESVIPALDSFVEQLESAKTEEERDNIRQAIKEYLTDPKKTGFEQVDCQKFTTNNFSTGISSNDDLDFEGEDIDPIVPELENLLNGERTQGLLDSYKELFSPTQF